MSSVVVDKSALVAILLMEPEASQFEDVLLRAGEVLISDLNRFELAVVMLRRRGPRGVEEAATIIDLVGIETRPVDARQSEAATAAYARFGKGIHPQARLNLAGCAAYALATALAAPLLFKGTDCAATDVLRAV